MSCFCLFPSVDGLLPAGGSRFLLTCTDTVGNRGGARLLYSFPQECASVLYRDFSRDFAPKMDPNLIYRLSDLVNSFELLCGIGGYDVSSICGNPGLFDQAYYHRPCLIWGHWLSQVFALMCLERLCCGEVIRRMPVRA